MEAAETAPSGRCNGAVVGQVRAGSSGETIDNTQAFELDVSVNADTSFSGGEDDTSGLVVSIGALSTGGRGVTDDGH